MEHIEENLIDQYAMGSLAGDALAQIEEHLLCCPVCQRKLLAADEFLTAFRPAAADVDTHVTAGWFPRLRLSRGLWAAAAAVCGLLIFIATEDIRKPKLLPVIVSMQSMRGPESTQQISAGRASRLVFDISIQPNQAGYEIDIVDSVGNEVLHRNAEVMDGRLAVLIDKLPPGSYWVRVYHKQTARELVSEYGLRVE